MRSRCLLVLAFLLSSSVQARELATFEIKEPLGRTWTDEWLTHAFTIDLGGHRMPTFRLDLTTADGESLPAQFYAEPEGTLLDNTHTPWGKMRLKVLFKATIEKNSTARFVVTDQGKLPRTWNPVKIETLDWIGRDIHGRPAGGVRTTVVLGAYRFSPDTPWPFPHVYFGKPLTGVWMVLWPADVKMAKWKNTWLEQGPAREQLL